MPTIYTNHKSGTITADPGAAGVTINSAGLANLDVVAAPDTVWLVLDPTGVNGAPEIVQVTTHTASATSATVVRAQQGTTGRAHPIGTSWVIAATKADLDELPFRKMTTTGDMLYASAANTTARLAVGTSGLPVVSNGAIPAYAQVGTAGIADSSITSAKIADGTIVNADIATAAAIAYAKLSLAGSIVNADVAAAAAIAYSKLALTNSIVNADVSSSAAIAMSKLATGTAGQVVLHNGSGVPTSTTVSGDVTITGTGVTTIAANAITTAKITDANVTTAKLADSSVTSAKIADGTIVAADIANGTITYGKMAGLPMCRLGRGSSYQVFSGEQDITWDNEYNDTNGFFGSGSTITIPAGLGGVYSISGIINTTSALTANGYVKLVCSSGTFTFYEPSGNNNVAFSTTTYLGDGATVKVTGYSNISNNFTALLELFRVGSV